MSTAHQSSKGPTAETDQCMWLLQPLLHAGTTTDTRMTLYIDYHAQVPQMLRIIAGNLRLTLETTKTPDAEVFTNAKKRKIKAAERQEDQNPFVRTLDFTPCRGVTCTCSRQAP